MNQDIHTNIVAVQSAKLCCSGKTLVKDVGFQSCKTWSSLFNLACFQIAGEQFDVALETLEKAKGMTIFERSKTTTNPMPKGLNQSRRDQSQCIPI
jgi:hypothetical protein